MADRSLHAPPQARAAKSGKTDKSGSSASKRPSTGAGKKTESKKRQEGSAKAAPKPKPQGGAGADRETSAEEPLKLAARGAIALDSWSGLPLFEKNADTRFYPASTTKIMTALLVIESGGLEQEVEVTADDARVGESSLSIRPGERFTRRQMLYGLLLKSANDVAHALGRDNAGSIAEFAAKMNRRAEELGCSDTRFQNPHGLHHPNHYTTPRDLSLIARAAMAQPLFRQIVATRSAPWTGERGSITLTNHNRLLEKFPGCIGVKTGYTIPAQQVLASAAQKDGREAIAIVMHTDKPGIWEDSAKLLHFALEQPARTESSAGAPR
jgi:D-alanyl-D-alanine carboxypeptidase (penicillin-binding protein 5/6)